MSVQSTHADYDASLAVWQRARDVIAGEDAVKRAGAKYLPRLESQSDTEFAAYVARASFFNATARTADGYLGLIFRRAPFMKLPDETTPKHTNNTKEAGESPSPQPSPPRGRGSSALGEALRVFANDVDMLGTPLQGYAKNVVAEVLAVGRTGTLIDWEGEVENRAYAILYSAENILNWRVERVNGRNVPTLVVLAEKAEARSHKSEVGSQNGEGDEFEAEEVEQLRVLKLVEGRSLRGEGQDGHQQSTPNSQPACVVEVWRRVEKKSGRDKTEWQVVETRVPLRRGKPLPLLPFVFHGPSHSLPAVEKPPLGDIIAVNLDHYRLDADYKHGIHFTALPTAWVSGFAKDATLRIGSSTAWTTDTVGAAAGFLEFTGQGLSTFERAMDRDERLMAVLGSRLLAEQKRVGETAEAMEIRQGGENSILAHIATSVSGSLTQMLRWAYWWNSTEETPEAVPESEVLFTLNTDYSIKGMAAAEVVALVQAWQSRALSTDTLHELFRRGEILPEGRTNEEEQALIAQSKPASTINPQPSTLN